ncbi:hypothetical protein WJX81_003531 [Elliptochloris bilobata]|uniref:PLAT domain-containing protein n=1 Tax=Elliptochloris bilobata TaxID=381761 RepID=A0AAW1R2D6_9CHLO
MPDGAPGWSYPSAGGPGEALGPPADLPRSPALPRGEGARLLASERVRRAAWLLKAYGDGPQLTWRRKWVFLLDDRLCYADTPGAAPNTRYLPLDRIPVRALPRGYGPHGSSDCRLLASRESALRWENSHLRRALWGDDSEAQQPVEGAAECLMHRSQAPCPGCMACRAPGSQGCATYDIQVITGDCEARCTEAAARARAAAAAEAAAAGEARRLQGALATREVDAAAANARLQEALAARDADKQAAAVDALRLKQALADGQAASTQRAAVQAQAEALQRELAQARAAQQAALGQVATSQLQAEAAAAAATERVGSAAAAEAAYHRAETALAAAMETAQVFFELIGERGRSGAVVLAAAAPSAFRAGGTEAFTFPLLAPRGDLTWLRVGTDGSGLLPGWHLRRVEVVHSATGRRWDFGCYGWIDGDCGFQRTLALEAYAGPGYDGGGGESHALAPQGQGGSQFDYYGRIGDSKSFRQGETWVPESKRRQRLRSSAAYYC